MTAGGMSTVADVLAAILLLAGAFLSFAAGMGLMRFPDLLGRMHAATKPQVLGMMLMTLGLALRIRTTPVVWMLVLVALFQMLTSPVAAHMVSRAGYRTGKVRRDLLVVDELTRDLETARAAAGEGADIGDDDLFAEVERAELEREAAEAEHGATHAETTATPAETTATHAETETDRRPT